MSEMAALVPAPATYSSPSNLCGELEVHCFVHILESDQVVIQFVVPSFPVQCSMLGIVLSRRMMKYMYTYMMDLFKQGTLHHGKGLYPETLLLLL